MLPCRRPNRTNPRTLKLAAYRLNAACRRFRATTASSKPVASRGHLSGPTAGAVGAVFIGAAAGYRNLIGIDIGGTSADITLVHDGEPGLTTSGHIGDWPLGLPMIDITTIGAGGGSIARYSPDGALTVGPQSAGAEPGPVCYDRGGTEPTVTDAHLVLGHLRPYLLDGAFALDTEAARRAIATGIAEPMRLGLEDAARGILAIADNHMTGAIRVVSVERGHFDSGRIMTAPAMTLGKVRPCSFAVCGKP